MKTFTRKWFAEGKSLMALAQLWIKQGYISPAAWLGASQALADYKAHMAELESGREAHRQAFRERRKEELRLKRFRDALRNATPAKPMSTVIDRGPRSGIIYALPEYEDRSDVMPRLNEGLRKRIS